MAGRAFACKDPYLLASPSLLVVLLLPVGQLSSMGSTCRAQYTTPPDSPFTGSSGFSVSESGT